MLVDCIKKGYAIWEHLGSKFVAWEMITDFFAITISTPKEREREKITQEKSFVITWFDVGESSFRLEFKCANIQVLKNCVMNDLYVCMDSNSDWPTVKALIL